MNNYILYLLELMWWWFQESFLFKHFIVETLEIDLGVLIFLLCDGKKFSGTLFSWNACAEMRDDFEAKIMKIEDRAKL